MSDFQALLAFCFQIVQLVFDWLSYYKKKTRPEFEEENYHTSTEVYQIWFRYKSAADIEFSRKNNFASLFHKFTHPKIILRDTVSLYSLTEKTAVFVDCGDVDVFSSKTGPFTYVSQYKHAKKLIVLPIKSFHKISDEIKVPNIPIIHLANHGRCGSTLISNVFESIQDTFSISETNAFTDLAELSRLGRVSPLVIKKLSHSTLLCSIKHANARNSKIMFFKCQNIALYITDYFIDVLPTIKHVYMYRNPIAFVRSYEKLYFVNHWLPLETPLQNVWCGIGHNKILSGTPVYPHFYVHDLSMFAKLGLIWITSSAAFQNLLKKGYEIKSLKFEDLLAEPEKTMQRFFDYVGINEKLMPDLKLVMSKDSQAGSTFSSRHVDKKILESTYTPITDALKEEVNGLCNDFDVPLFWDDVKMPQSF